MRSEMNENVVKDWGAKTLFLGEFEQPVEAVVDHMHVQSLQD